MTSEIGHAYLFLTTSVESLPPRVFGPMSPMANTACRPCHALISVEGGDVRYRLDGSDPQEPFGLLAKNGSLIDWTDPLQDFSSFIGNARFMATGDTPGALLNISWRE